MNVVKAIPLPQDEPSHLVIAADSDGNLHIVIVPETVIPRQTTIGNIVQGSGRPILCLDWVEFAGIILIFTGSTSGEIAIWDISPYANGCIRGERINDHSPLFSVDVHSSGVNDLSAAIVNQTASQAQLVLCSAGDDQTLSSYSFAISKDTLSDEVAVELLESQFIRTRNSSASPMKAVKVAIDSSLPFYLVYTTGQDGFVTLWHLEIQPLAIKHISSSSLGVEGSCIDCTRMIDSNGFEQELIAIGGEGTELQCINYSAIKAAKQLYNANYLLVTAGAGFSADSGLATYECSPAEYKELCDPSQLIANANLFQEFWFKFTETYRRTKPHIGYELLDQWCSGSLMPNLVRDNGSSSISPWYVYTSNVDGHFRKFRSFEDTICEIHGNADEYICSCRIGFSDGIQRLGAEWDQWNQRASKLSACKQSRIRIADDSIEESKHSVLKCDNCQLPLRPKVLMFNDTDENVLKDIAIQQQRYQTWESQVEEAISHNKSKLVILELGCGVNVPAVRQESEEVLSDCAHIIETQEDDSKGSVCLIRVNPKDSEVKVGEFGKSFQSISMTTGAKDALEQIDFWLKQMLNDTATT
jgi:NAD-dependent SIR2 family protein deacetylase